MQAGELIDNNGTTYSADFDGTNVTVATTNQETSESSQVAWAPNSPAVNFTDTAGLFSGDTVTFTQPRRHELLRGSVTSSSSPREIAFALRRSGFVYWIGFHRGREYRTEGDERGRGSSHMTVQAGTQGGGPPSTRVTFHTGEIYPGYNLPHHFLRDVIGNLE